MRCSTRVRKSDNRKESDREKERERESTRESVCVRARERATRIRCSTLRAVLSVKISRKKNFSALQLFSTVNFAVRRLLRNFYPGHSFSKVSPKVLLHRTFCSAPIFEKHYRTRRHSLPVPTRGPLGGNFSKVSSLPNVLCKKTTGLTFEKLYP